MTQRPFPVFHEFIETAFERRFQAMLRSAWQKRAWHVIVADPGSGKTMGIKDLVRTTGSPSGTLSPRNGVLRFPAHSKRKTRTPNTEQRWAMEKTIWEVVGGERK